MQYQSLFITLILNCISIAFALPYTPWYPDMSDDVLNAENGETIQESVLAIKKIDEKDNDFMDSERKKYDNGRKDKPCSIVLISSSHQIPAMQTLLRKYKYDSQGVLIPNSVRYFMKTQTGTKRSAAFRLIPLNHQSFTPLGGFVRYYKEVPPIPQIL